MKKRSKLTIIAATILLGLILGYWQTVPRHPGVPKRAIIGTLPQSDSPLIRHLKGERYSEAQTLIQKSSIENQPDLLAQIIHFFDTTPLSPQKKWTVIKLLLDTLGGQDKLSPRTIVLLGKICSKFPPSSDLERSLIETFFERHKERFATAWVEASVAWQPPPQSTMKLLKAMKTSGKHHEVRDFEYFRSYIQDPSAQKELDALLPAAEDSSK